MSGKAVFQVKARRASSTANKLRGAPGRIQAALAAEFRGAIREELLDVGRSHAPEDTGALKGGLNVRVGFGGGEVSATLFSTVRDPESGYAYTDVTRVGHAGPILGRPGRPLHFQGLSGWVSVYQSAGHHPRFDWVERVEAEMERVTARESRKL